MAKFALLFVAAFCIVQIAMSARLQRDTVDQPTEITTESFLDSIKSGLKKTFSDENINKAKDKLSEFGGQVKNYSSIAYDSVSTGVQNILKKNEASTEAPIIPSQNTNLKLVQSSTISLNFNLQRVRSSKYSHEQNDETRFSFHRCLLLRSVRCG